MTQDELKALVGRAALEHVVEGGWVGVGTGSTVNHFIDALATMKHRIRGAVSSSEASTARLRGHGIEVVDAAAVDRLPVYIDGADEIDHRGHMVKGGGAALTREKIVADLAERFVCIADESKLVPVLGRFPLPVEVIPMAAPQVARRFAALGGQAALACGRAHRQRPPHPGRAWPADQRPAGDGDGNQPVAGGRDGGHLCAPPRGGLPAGHAGRGSDTDVLDYPCRPTAKENHLAKPNYSFEKRQRELAKKKKKEEKASKKSSGGPEEMNPNDAAAALAGDAPGGDDTPADGAPPAQP